MATRTEYRLEVVLWKVEVFSEDDEEAEMLDLEVELCIGTMEDVMAAVRLLVDMTNNDEELLPQEKLEEVTKGIWALDQEITVIYQGMEDKES